MKPIEGFGVGRVIDSTHPGFSAGDFVSGMTGWEDYSLITKPEQLRKIQQSDIPLSYHLGLLGQFLTCAYFSIFFISYILSIDNSNVVTVEQQQLNYFI